MANLFNSCLINVYEKTNDGKCLRTIHTFVGYLKWRIAVKLAGASAAFDGVVYAVVHLKCFTDDGATCPVA